MAAAAPAATMVIRSGRATPSSIRSETRGASGMRELDFTVTSWFDSAEADPVHRATFASLHIEAGGVPVTEVEDVIARTVRPDILVSAYRVAQWLLVNWWRLR